MEACYEPRPAFGGEEGQDFQGTAARTPRRLSLNTVALACAMILCQGIVGKPYLSFQALCTLRQGVHLGKNKGRPQQTPSLKLPVSPDIYQKTNNEEMSRKSRLLPSVI